MKKVTYTLAAALLFVAPLTFASSYNYIINGGKKDMTVLYRICSGQIGGKCSSPVTIKIAPNNGVSKVNVGGTPLGFISIKSAQSESHSSIYSGVTACSTYSSSAVQLSPISNGQIFCTSGVTKH